MQRRGLPQNLENNKKANPLPLHYEIIFSTLSKIICDGTSTGTYEWRGIDNLALPEKTERQLLFYHGIVPLVSDWDSNGTTLSNKKQWLDQIAMLGAMRESEWRQTLNEISEQFEISKIRALVVKGTGLAYTLYTKPHHRPRNDIDLWISEKDRVQVQRALWRAGYRTKLEDTAAGFSLIKEASSHLMLNIDVKFYAHCRPFFYHSMSFDEEWEKSIPTEISIRTTSPSTALLLSAWNRVGDLSWNSRAMPMIQIVDVLRLWEKLGDHQVLELIKWSDARGLGEALRYLLFLALSCRSQRIEPALANQLWSKEQKGRSRFYFQEGFNDYAALTLDIQSISSWQKKIEYLFRLMVPAFPQLWYWWNLTGWKKNFPRLSKVLLPLLSPFLYCVNIVRILLRWGQGFLYLSSLNKVKI